MEMINIFRFKFLQFLLLLIEISFKLKKIIYFFLYELFHSINIFLDVDK